MGNVFYFQFEINFILWLQSIGQNTALQSVLITIFNGISILGEQMVAIVVFGAIYWGIDKQKGKTIGLTVVLNSIFNSMIKNIVCRLRPWFSDDRIQNFRDVDGYSFPSGHSSNSSSVFNGLALAFKKKYLKILAFIIPPLVALSRNYLGAHFITDVLAGLTSGYCISYLVNKFYEYLDNNKSYLIILLIALIGLFYCKTTDYFSAIGILIGVILAFNFEKKYVNFENTNKWYLVILRTLFGVLIYLVMDKILKAIISLFVVSEYVELLLRSVRYLINVFILVGIYPLSFKLVKKLLKR